MRRGFTVDPGGGLKSVPQPSEPSALSDVLQSRLWTAISAAHNYELQSAIFQPKGGMGMIGKAMGRELGPLIAYNCKVTDIHQDDGGVTVRYADSRGGKEVRTAKAKWCVCTIPTPILAEIPMNVGPKMKAAIDQLPYLAALKIGLQFKRRFWEEDEDIYGGHSYTDMPIATIGYPMWDYFSRGKGVLLGAYTFGRAAYIAAAKPPQDRIQDALEQGAVIHPQYKTEFENGVAMAWHRVPWAMGCQGAWTEDSRAVHYDDLCALDGRIVLANEHASRLPGWQEGSVTSALDAISRLHAKVIHS
jgi:monoamine oxidase